MSSHAHHPSTVPPSAPYPALFTAQRMSSLELAEITGKGHKHVMRDIRDLIDQGALRESKTGLTSRTVPGPNNSKREEPLYTLDFQATMVLVTGYDAKRRALVIERWAKLKTGEACPAMSSQPAASPFPSPLITEEQSRHLRELMRTRLQASNYVTTASAEWARVRELFGICRLGALPSALYPRLRDILSGAAPIPTRAEYEPPPVAVPAVLDPERYAAAEAAIATSSWINGPHRVGVSYFKKQMVAAGIETKDGQGIADLQDFMEMGVFLAHQFPKMCEKFLDLMLEARQGKLLKARLDKLTGALEQMAALTKPDNAGA